MTTNEVPEVESQPADRAGRLSVLLRDPDIVRLFRLMATVAVGGLSVATFGLVIARCIVPMSDPDTWWHLVMGHRFLDGTSIRDPGPMSWAGTEEWYPRDWSVQMLAAAFEDWFGLPGVAWLYGLGVVVFVVAVYRLCRRRASFASASIATAACLLAAMSSLTARPQLVSFVLLVVVVGALLGTVEDLRPRWWLAILTGLWACAHGMWFLSPALQVAVMVGLAMDRRLDWRSSRSHVALAVLSLAAVAVTPNGLRLLQAPLGPSDVRLSQYVQETQPPSFQSLYYAVTLAMLGFVVLTWARRGLRVDWARIVLLAAAAFFAVQTLRTVTVGAILVVALFAEALDVWLARAPVRVPRVIERSLIYGGAAAAVLVIGLVVPSTADEPGPDYAIAFSDHVEDLPDDAIVLDDLGDGGYLTWRYPQLRITLDGLSDQYSFDYLADAFGASALEPGWEDFVTETGATHALLAKDSLLETGLQLIGWRKLAEDSQRVLLERP